MRIMDYVVLCLFMCAGVGAEVAEKDSCWPAWRGPGLDGMAVSGNPPVTWSESKNIKWKIDLPGESSSTPVVWGNKIIIQTAVPGNEAGKMLSGLEIEPSKREGIFTSIKDSQKIYAFDVVCFDSTDGKQIWRKTVCVAQPHEGHHKDHGYASYSPVTDGKNIWVSFGSRGMYCLDMDGNMKWSREMPKMKTRVSFGEGSSPAIAGDKIIVLADHEGDSAIFALDRETGKLAWRKDRDELTSWTTPVTVEVDGKWQVIVCGSNFTRSYDLDSGDVVWKCSGQTQNVIPTPLVGFGMVYCMSGFKGNTLQAIRLGKTGDLSGSDAIVWQLGKYTPYVPSGVLSGGKLFFCSFNSGKLSCVDAKTGKAYYVDQNLEGIKNVYASLVGVKDRIYIVARDGTAAVVDNSGEFKVLAVNKLDDGIDASPVIVGDELYLKGLKHLYCIAEKE